MTTREEQKAALSAAQSSGEAVPVAWREETMGKGTGWYYDEKPWSKDAQPLYAAPVPRLSEDTRLALKAIKSALNEVYGVWGAFEISLRQEISNTNYAVVREKLDAAERALETLRLNGPGASPVILTREAE